MIGGIRGVFFANLGAGWFNNQRFRFATSNEERVPTIIGYQQDVAGRPIFDPVTDAPIAIYGPDRVVSGLRLRDGRASYGIGLETFALGFPIHFDWSWRTLLNKDFEDYVFAYQGIQEGLSGSKWFRKPRFSMWIGYDF